MAASEEKTYTVTVTETKTWTVEVHACSSEEAKDLVEARHQTCEDYDEVYYDIEFEAESEDEEEVNETPRKKGDVTEMIEEAVKELEENVNIDKSLIEVAQELQAENDKLKEEMEANKKTELDSWHPTIMSKYKNLVFPFTFEGEEEDTPHGGGFHDPTEYGSDGFPTEEEYDRKEIELGGPVIHCGGGRWKLG